MTPIALPAQTPLFRIARGAMLPVLAISAYAIALQTFGRGEGMWENSPLLLGIHLATVIPALPLGAWVLRARKGDARHKQAGRIWAMAMMITAIVSLWLRSDDGSMSPIHIFSFMTMLSIPMGVYYAKVGNIGAHRSAMMGPYVGLAIAGMFAFLPGRLLGTLVFG